MGLSRLFEDFATDSLATAPRDEDLPGYAAGHRAGLAEAARSRDAVAADAAQAIADLTFTYAEASQQVLTSLRPLLAVLTDHLLPTCAPDSLRRDISRHLESAANDVLDQPLTIHLHPDAVEPMSSALSPTLAARVTLRPDDTISPLAAHLRCAAGETLFDRQSLIGAVTALIAELDAPETKGSKHG